MSWVLSLVGASVLLWIASHWIELWPDPLVMPQPRLWWAAVAVHLPYAFVRAFRLRYVLDPVVARASGQPGRRVPSALLHGSGLVSFLVVILLPLRLGELSRPVLLARGREPGLEVPEAVSAVAVERIVDGLVVVGLLFGGLALSGHESADPEVMAYVVTSGRFMAAVFVCGLVVLGLAARNPELLGKFLGRIPGVGASLAGLGARVAEPLRVLWQWRQGVPFLLWTLVYWGITVLQLWLVARACGLPLGPGEAAAVVAIVGLAIQLPGGPAQAGSFQVGMALALGVYVDPGVYGGGSTFAAMMYLLQLGGAAALAVPGAVLLALGRSGGPKPNA